MTHHEAGKLNDDFCSTSKEYICKKGLICSFFYSFIPQTPQVIFILCFVVILFCLSLAKGQGPPPQPPTSGPGWNDKCGSWTSDPFNDYCYLFNYLSLRTWAEARADCSQGKLSCHEFSFCCCFPGVIAQSPTGISLWMGGHDSITEGGWEWTDGSPFRYIHWNAGNPDDYYGEDCLSILINKGHWNDDNCENKRGYICKRRGVMYWKNTRTPSTS
uniref:C-type lectin domain-containing protein n=1 Tax=Mastacembelus armatus TaxID=205130 RepID=A0A7N8XMB0_9TELE